MKSPTPPTLAASSEELLQALGRAIADSEAAELEIELSPQDKFERRVATSLRRGQTPTPSLKATPARTAPSWPRLAAWTLPLTAAAAFAVWLASNTDVTPAGDSLSTYELTIVAAVSQTRSGVSSSTEGDALTLAPPYSPEFLLRPETAVSGEVATRVWVVSEGGSREWTHKAQNAASGAIRLVLEQTDALPASGELVLLLGRAHTVRSAKGPKDRPAGPGWQQFRRAFRIGPSG